ncbi:MAG: C25 family cysteine peptidase [Candidatus Neomarinimicrobiota bacterium]|jgi:hypothetical protein|nr:C25 family cysteine peptidase [Candidatus Neomarinimicrobiota bacterium]
MIRSLIFIFTSILGIAQLFGDVGERIIFSSTHELRFVVTINNPHKGDLYPVHFLIGLPSENYPVMNASFQNKRTCPENCNDLTDTGVEWIQKQKLQRLNTATLKVSPYAGQNEYYSEILITIQFDDPFQGPEGNLSKHQKGLLAVRVLNWETAKDWIIPVSQRQRGETDQSFAPLLKNLVDEAEYIIIGPQDFESASQPLLVHRNSELKTAYVPLEEIYSEFLNENNSEAEAINLFILHAVDNWTDSFAFALLMGDIEFIPTMYTGSDASDDLLATQVDGNIPLVALGRYPARNVADVDAFVEKIIAYETNPELGLWRQRVTLVADDVSRPRDNDVTHIINSELLALNYIPPFIDVQKLYLTEYPEVSDASAYGVVKPDATEALFDMLNNGTAIINYIGHGSSSTWAQEQLLEKNRGDIQFINTGMKLPIWIAGTCSWGQFDDPNTDAFSEDLIRLPMNGAAAIITTSRSIGYSPIPDSPFPSPNKRILEHIFNTIFDSGSVTNYPIGTIIQSVKIGIPVSDSLENTHYVDDGRLFHLFGDPAMTIPIPKDTLNSIDVNPDTLITLEVAEFTGTNPFNSGGTGYVILKDSKREVERTFGSVTISYILPGATLFQGQFTFSGDNFSGDLIVPEDISYSQNSGRLNVYLISNDSTREEAVGTYSPVYFTSGSSVHDDEGPIISFETKKGRILKSDDHFRNNETLVIRLEDSLGINLAGEPGHEISLTDLTTRDVTDITNRFIYDPNSIQTGTIQPNLDGFSETINIHIKAWNSANKPSEKDIYLNQAENNSLRLFQVMNYPNPFKTSTQFVFEISTPAEVSIDVYTLSGRKIKSFEKKTFQTAGYYTVNWEDGRDSFGGELANGVYLYRVKADANGSSVSTIGRMAKFR